jgi:hypothetical protein
MPDKTESNMPVATISLPGSASRKCVCHNSSAVILISIQFAHLAADTSPRMASERSFAFRLGSLTVWQRQRSDSSQHAAKTLTLDLG